MNSPKVVREIGILTELTFSTPDFHWISSASRKLQCNEELQQIVHEMCWDIHEAAFEIANGGMRSLQFMTVFDVAALIEEAMKNQPRLAAESE